jgi:predicted amidophosphoribosyltransferase
MGPSEVTDSLCGMLTPVPRSGPGVCRVCHGATRELTHAYCPVCYRAVYHQLRRDGPLIVPISLCTQGDGLYRLLQDYKRSPDGEVRRRASQAVASLLVRFVTTHTRCIHRAARRGWEQVTVVPSGRDRGSRHPLEEALEQAGWTPVRTLCRGPGALGRNLASEDAYRAVAGVSGKSLLLVDDLYDSGAHLQSAAAALRVAGADVVAGVPVARVLEPEPPLLPGFGGPRQVVRELLDRVCGSPYEFGRCCLES